MCFLDMADECFRLAGMKENDYSHSLNGKKLHFLNDSAENSFCNCAWSKFHKLVQMYENDSSVLLGESDGCLVELLLFGRHLSV